MEKLQNILSARLNRVSKEFTELKNIKHTPYSYLLGKYIDNIELFFTDYTVSEYSKNKELIELTKSLMLAISNKDNQDEYVFQMVDFWGKSCFEFFKSKWLEEKDAEWLRIKVSERMNWNSLEKYSWEE